MILQFLLIFTSKGIYLRLKWATLFVSSLLSMNSISSLLALKALSFWRIQIRDSLIEKFKNPIPHLDNRPIILFHLCDTVDAFALRLWDRLHGQTQEGALRRWFYSWICSRLLKTREIVRMTNMFRQKYQEAESSDDPVCPLPVRPIQQVGHHWGKDNCPKSRTTCWDSWREQQLKEELLLKKFTHGKSDV